MPLSLDPLSKSIGKQLSVLDAASLFRVTTAKGAWAEVLLSKASCELRAAAFTAEGYLFLRKLPLVSCAQPLGVTPGVDVYGDCRHARCRLRLIVALGRIRAGAALRDVALCGVPYAPWSATRVIVITILAVCIGAPPEGAIAARAIGDEEVVLTFWVNMAPRCRLYRLWYLWLRHGR